MALKITVPIGTDNGITSEAYVRITDYSISKFGNAAFRIEIFQSQEAATSSLSTLGARTAITSKNHQIGDTVNVSLMVDKQVMVPAFRSVVVEVPVEREVPDTKDEEGNILTLKTVTMMEPQVQTENVEELMTIKVADLSSLEDVNIFAYGYAQVKAKLVTLFGEGNVEDC